VKELKEEIEDRNRQVQDAQKKVQDLHNERYADGATQHANQRFLSSFLYYFLFETITQRLSEDISRSE
jgi:molecular chaperone GrpE (heat shock protein)